MIDYDYNFLHKTFCILSIYGGSDRLAPLICGVYGVDDAVLVNSLSQYGVHQVLEVPWFALLLDPAEDAAGQLGEIVHADLLVERLEQGVHEDLENLKPTTGQTLIANTLGPNLKLDLVWHEVLLHLGSSLVSLHKLLIVGSHDLKGNNLE